MTVVRLQGGPFNGHTVTVSDACRVFTIPVSYRRTADDEFVFCRTPTYLGQGTDDLEWPENQLTIEEEQQ